LVSLIYTLQFTVTHTLGFSVFSSRTLVTAFNTGTTTVSQNHRLQVSLYYSTHTDFSSLLDFQLNSLESSIIWKLPARELSSSYPGRLASRNSTDSNDLLRPFYNRLARTTQKTSSVVEKACAQKLFDCCLLIRCPGNVFTKHLPSNGRLL
jgi:hypothetical protein